MKMIKKPSRYFGKIKDLLNGEINGWSFSNPIQICGPLAYVPHTMMLFQNVVWEKCTTHQYTLSDTELCVKTIPHKNLQ